MRHIRSSRRERCPDQLRPAHRGALESPEKAAKHAGQADARSGPSHSARSNAGSPTSAQSRMSSVSGLRCGARAMEHDHMSDALSAGSRRVVPRAQVRIGFLPSGRAAHRPSSRAAAAGRSASAQEARGERQRERRSSSDGGAGGSLGSKMAQRAGRRTWKETCLIGTCCVWLPGPSIAPFDC